MSSDPASTYVALLHHPMRDVTGAVVTTALTTLDLHDIARTCRTYGLGGYFVVHPLAPQRAIAERITRYWHDEGRHDFRRQALERVHVAESLDAVIHTIESQTKQRPVLVATSAKKTSRSIGFDKVLSLPSPTLLLLGTGFGMTEELLGKADHILLPVRGPSDYNHLSVRSACAILLDRMYGDRQESGPFGQSSLKRSIES